MARGTSMAQWFVENPRAQKECEKFIQAREEGNPASVREMLMFLVDHFEFPFTSEPSLVRHLKAMGLGDRPDDDKPAVVYEPTASASRIARLKKAKTLVVTAAQNAAPVDHDFLDALLAYCDATGAELVVRKIRYGKPHTWDSSVEDYLVDDEIELRDVIIPDVRITATVADPLTSLDSRSGAKHAIYASTKLSMKTVATPQNTLPKILYSTGCVTLPAYSETKTGNLAEFHHSLSAIVVEQDKRKGHTFIRAICWDGEGFQDLYEYWDTDGLRGPERWLALVPGDEHAWFVDPGVLKATYTGSDNMADLGRPEYVMRHDLLDCYSISHHHRGDLLAQRNKAVLGWGSLQKELDDTIEYVIRTTGRNRFKNVMVYSNHSGSHLAKFLASGESHVSMENLLIYHELSAMVLRSSRKTKTGIAYTDPFQLYWEARDRGIESPVWLSSTDPFILADVDLAQHGHLGPNGSRGSIRNLSNIGVKVILGHTHAPGIHGGATQVGTSSRYDLEYCRGPSSWLHCHAALFRNGKRQLLPIIDGKWFADR